MIPTKAEIEKKKKQLDLFLKQLDNEGRAREKDLVTVVRSAIRKSWMRSPTKLAYLAMHTVPDMDDSTRTKWKVQCEMCGEWFKMADVQVDHRFGNHSFTKVSDFENYFDKILNVGFDDLQILCTENCHAIKTYSERIGISMEQARIEKISIDLENKKMLIDFLKSHNVTPAKNAKLRRKQAIELLTKEQEDEQK